MAGKNISPKILFERIVPFFKEQVDFSAMRQVPRVFRLFP